jgi:hypothetical protein
MRLGASAPSCATPSIPKKLKPNLFQIFGRPAGADQDFDYSDAMREKAAAGLIGVPRPRMSVAPLRDAQERADLIAFLARPDAYRRKQVTPFTCARFSSRTATYWRITALVHDTSDMTINVRRRSSSR